MADEKRKCYCFLLKDLDEYIVEGNAAHKRLITVAKSYSFKPKELKHKDFMTLCDKFEEKNHLNPYKLNVLKEIFPEDENNEAFKKIISSETQIEGNPSFLYIFFLNLFHTYNFKQHTILPTMLQNCTK